MSKNNLIISTLILTFASFITRILGFIFRIYMSNIMGPEGLGLYQLVFPVYMLAWTISGAGISVAVSKLVATETAKNQSGNAIRILKISVFLSASIGFIISCILYVFSEPIAVKLLHEPRTALSLKYLSSCIPFMAATSSIKGYFYGKQEMSKPAIGQVVEQVGRMVAIYAFAGFFVSKGLEYASTLGVIGMCIGEFLAFFYVVGAYKFKGSIKNVFRPSFSRRQSFMMIVSLAIPLTFNRFITSLLQSIENILIPIKLQEFGLTNHQALSVYGQFTGMTMPLIFFPSMVTMSLSTALIPAVSHASTIQNKRQLQYTVSKSIHFTLLIGVGSTALFMSLPHEIAMACYNQPAVGNMLYALSFICPFFYLQSTLLGILNGLGKQLENLVSHIIGSAACIGITWFYVPKKGLIGFIAALVISSALITLIHLFDVLKYTSIPIDILNWFVKPALAAAVGALSSKYILRNYLLSHFSMRTATFFAILSLGVFYISFLFILGSLTKEDIRMFKK